MTSETASVKIECAAYTHVSAALEVSEEVFVHSHIKISVAVSIENILCGQTTNKSAAIIHAIKRGISANIVRVQRA